MPKTRFGLIVECRAWMAARYVDPNLLASVVVHHGNVKNRASLHYHDAICRDWSICPGSIVRVHASTEVHFGDPSCLASTAVHHDDLSFLASMADPKDDAKICSALHRHALSCCFDSPN